MDWGTSAEKQLCQDLPRSNFLSKLNQSRHFSGKGQKELQQEYEKPEEESSMIQDILAAGKAAARSSAAASSAAQEASIAAAAAAENAKAALEEVEKLVNILEGHKCLKTTRMSSQKDINSFTHLDENKDETETSSDPINFEQKVEKNDVKEKCLN